MYPHEPSPELVVFMPVGRRPISDLPPRNAADPHDTRLWTPDAKAVDARQPVTGADRMKSGRRTIDSMQ